MASRIPVSMLVASGEHLPLRDRSCDTAVSVLTLCSVSDPSRVLRELARVLRENGRLISALVEGGGFRFEKIRRFYSENIPRTHGWITLGTAVKM